MSEDTDKYTVTVVKKRKRVKQICENCGSENVSSSFFCIWDVDLQKWIGVDYNDASEDWCNECDNEITIDSIPIKEGETT